MSIILTAKNVSKTFQDGKHETHVLHNLDLSINQGERVAIIGASGSGKSTLLHVLGGLDTPNTGEVFINGYQLNTLNETQRGQLRNQYLGFIYQFHHLLPEFSALENVAMPLLMRDEVGVKQARQQAQELLEHVGLSHRVTHRPGELSGGERQRVAIARALVTKPALVLADEPTGNLDQQNAAIVFDLLTQLQKQMGMALLMVTHDRNLAAKADKTLVLQDGRWLIA